MRYNHWYKKYFIWYFCSDFWGLKLHQISNFPLLELTALSQIPSWWGGGSLPPPKNPTSALALRPPPCDLQPPHINTWMKPWTARILRCCLLPRFQPLSSGATLSTPAFYAPPTIFRLTNSRRDNGARPLDWPVSKALVCLPTLPLPKTYTRSPAER